MVYWLPQTIEASAGKFPEREAFICSDRSLNYGELFLQTNQLAQLLAELGVRKGDRIGIYMHRCLETAVAIHGIMKAGAAYVPLDPHAPPARTRILLQDCGIRVVVTIPGHRMALKKVVDEPEQTGLSHIIGLKEEWGIPTIPWEAVFQLPGNQTPGVNILGSDLAYIMYTSGSTGMPKGIMHTHNSGLAYAKLSAALFGLNEHDRIGNHSPIYFDISTLGYFTAPLVAAATVIVPEAYTKMPASLAQLIATTQMTVWYSVPLALIQLVQSEALDSLDMSALRWVLFGGEPFPTKHLRTLMELWPGARFSNIYGPAEVNQCTYYHVPAPPETNAAIPLGRTWDNTQGMIIDEQDEPVSEGETGELLIRSATMMHGYWKQPELTRRSLFKRTADHGVEEIFYRTGDLVKKDAEGNLVFLGRKDRQIKVRGYRVELDEIVNRLLQHDAVEEAAVFPVKDVAGQWVIHARVTAAPGMPITETVLSEYLQEYLPRYARPEKITISASIPRTAAGKINHQELQETTTNPGNP